MRTALCPNKLIWCSENTLSHLMGFFYRTIRMVENGIKPAYVFDGKPPDLKAGVVSTSPTSCDAHRLSLYVALETF